MSDEWLEAISEVLADQPTWRKRAAARAASLQAREQEELHDFVQFLQSL
jgi:hypothetical protein